LKNLGLDILTILIGCVLIWVIWTFLRWVKLLRRGVVVEGRIEAHHCRKITEGKGGAVTYLSLVYSYSCNGTNYSHEELVDSGTYRELKDGDRVKVRCLPGDPTTAELEAPAFETLLGSFMNTQGIPVDSHDIFPARWRGD
jgi:uncharacterized protein DUF3592